MAIRHVEIEFNESLKSRKGSFSVVYTWRKSALVQVVVNKGVSCAYLPVEGEGTPSERGISSSLPASPWLLNHFVSRAPGLLPIDTTLTAASAWITKNMLGYSLHAIGIHIYHFLNREDCCIRLSEGEVFKPDLYLVRL